MVKCGSHSVPKAHVSEGGCHSQTRAASSETVTRHVAQAAGALLPWRGGPCCIAVSRPLSTPESSFNSRVTPGPGHQPDQQGELGPPACAPRQRDPGTGCAGLGGRSRDAASALGRVLAGSGARDGGVSGSGLAELVTAPWGLCSAWLLSRVWRLLRARGSLSRLRRKGVLRPGRPASARHIHCSLPRPPLLPGGPCKREGHSWPRPRSRYWTLTHPGGRPVNTFPKSRSPLP